MLDGQHNAQWTLPKKDRISLESKKNAPTIDFGFSLPIFGWPLCSISHVCLWIFWYVSFAIFCVWHFVCLPQMGIGHSWQNVVRSRIKFICVRFPFVVHFVVADFIQTRRWHVEKYFHNISPTDGRRTTPFSTLWFRWTENRFEWDIDIGIFSVQSTMQAFFLIAPNQVCSWFSQPSVTALSLQYFWIVGIWIDLKFERDSMSERMARNDIIISRIKKILCKQTKFAVAEVAAVAYNSISCIRIKVTKKNHHLLQWFVDIAHKLFLTANERTEKKIFCECWSALNGYYICTIERFAENEIHTKTNFGSHSHTFPLAVRLGENDADALVDAEAVDHVDRGHSRTISVCGYQNDFTFFPFIASIIIIIIVLRISFGCSHLFSWFVHVACEKLSNEVSGRRGRAKWTVSFRFVSYLIELDWLEFITFLFTHGDRAENSRSNTIRASANETHDIQQSMVVRMFRQMHGKKKEVIIHTYQHFI